MLNIPFEERIYHKKTKGSFSEVSFVTECQIAQGIKQHFQNLIGLSDYKDIHILACSFVRNVCPYIHYL